MDTMLRASWTGPAAPGASAGSRMAEVMAVLAAAAVATALPVAAHVVSPAVGIGICGLVGVLLAGFATATVPAALVCAYLFQNLAVALVSPWIDDPSSFNTIRAYNFVLTAAAWLVLVGAYWTAPARWDGRLRRWMLATTACLAAVFLYFAVGALSSASAAAAYLRNIAAPLLLFQVCLLVCARCGRGTISSLWPVGYAALAYGYAELLSRPWLYSLLNIDAYLDLRFSQDQTGAMWVREMAETGRVYRGIEDVLRIDFLNTPLLADLNLQVFRLLGPNLHSISYAYALAFFATMLLGHRRPFYFVAALPLLLTIGSKGALILCAIALVGFLAAGMVRPRLLLTVGVVALAVYGFSAVVIGLRIGDYHALGLLGGIRGFLHNPVGHGLGVGGNLSVDMTQIDWSRSQHLGTSDLAVESAIGVILFQMGLVGLVVVAAYCGIALKAWRAFALTGNTALALLALAILTTATNALLQEEALFAPLAMGLLMAMAGLMLGRPFSAAAAQPSGATAEPRRARATRLRTAAR
jgi:hypothetical protein